jgi:hypothetical protein
MSRATAEVPMRADAVAADRLAVEAVGLVKSYGRVRVLDGSASPASTRPWTSSRPARRICG